MSNKEQEEYTGMILAGYVAIRRDHLGREWVDNTTVCPTEAECLQKIEEDKVSFPLWARDYPFIRIVEISVKLA